MSRSLKMMVFPIIGLLLTAMLQLTQGQTVAPSPSADPPSSGGTAIDQGIAYILLLVALAVTYLLH